jgi:hypothetical protein
LRAELGVAGDLLVDGRSVPEEVSGRVDRDHHRAVDALGMLPGIDHRGAGPHALADEVDAVVAERLARGLEVLDLLRQAVTRQVDTVVSEAVGASAERVAVRTEGRLAEEIGRVLEG